MKWKKEDYKDHTVSSMKSQKNRYLPEYNLKITEEPWQYLSMSGLSKNYYYMQHIQVVSGYNIGRHEHMDYNCSNPDYGWTIMLLQI